MKKYLKILFALSLLFSFPLLMLFGQKAGEGIRGGLQLAYHSVLPALFPAAVVCGILAELLEYLPIPPNHALWITAQLCGFPLGIKSVCRAYERGLIDRKRAVALSFCSANASPAFLILYVGGKLFGNLKIGVCFFAVQCLISFLFAYLGGAFSSCKCVSGSSESIFIILGNGISNAAIGCLGLTGYICLFSAIAAPMEAFSWFKYAHGFLEVTGGISKLNSHHLFLCSAMIGFSGISVFLQNASFLAQAHLPILPTLYGKILCGILMPMFLFIWIKYDSITLFGVFVVLLFLISFDKYRKRRYNKFIPYKRRRFL
ncbi:MAG: hypothetical protein IJ294_02625 [Clostridia bacterium]|nr:hypothetical protein [Clostridia bacterium]